MDKMESFCRKLKWKYVNVSYHKSYCALLRFLKSAHLKAAAPFWRKKNGFVKVQCCQIRRVDLFVHTLPQIFSHTYRKHRFSAGANDFCVVKQSFSPYTFDWNISTAVGNDTVLSRIYILFICLPKIRGIWYAWISTPKTFPFDSFRFDRLQAKTNEWWTFTMMEMR